MAGSKPKYASKVSGVYWREDGSTRWEVKFRSRGKTYREGVIYPVDLRITDPKDPMHVRRAQHAAETIAIKERARLKRTNGYVDEAKPYDDWTLEQLDGTVGNPGTAIPMTPTPRLM